MGKHATVNQWCYFADTCQDHPDLCVVGNGVFNKDYGTDGDSDNAQSIYYSWFKLSHIDSNDNKYSVYRRLRTAGADGYPNNCLVIDLGTAKELGLECTIRQDFDQKRLQKDLTHYRNTKLALSSRPKSKDNFQTLKEFINDESNDGFLKYRIRGIPINECDRGIEITEIKSHSLRAIWGRTIRNPDYALQVASKIAALSIVLGVLSLCLGIASVVIALT